VSRQGRPPCRSRIGHRFSSWLLDDFPLGQPSVGLLPPSMNLIRDVGAFSLGVTFIYSALTVALQHNAIRLALIDVIALRVRHSPLV
jgi:hypothetical protein